MSRFIVVALLGSSGCLSIFSSSPPPDGGTGSGAFAATWSIGDPRTLTPLTCEQIGADTVQISAYPSSFLFGNPLPTVWAFPCSAGAGQAQLDSGTWNNVRVEVSGAAPLFNSSDLNPSVTTNDTNNYNEMIIYSGVTTALPISIGVDRGGMILVIESEQPAHNCAPVNAGGAGMTGTTIAITYTDPAQSCVPMMLNISAGETQPASTYVVDCTPQIGPCIEDDQQVTVDGVMMGVYQLHVRGLVGSTECWTSDSALQISVGRSSNAAYLTATGASGCP